MKDASTKKSIFESPLFSTKIKSAKVKLPELIFGYFIGPFGALLAGGIFTAYINNYFRDVLFGDQRIPVLLESGEMGWTLPSNINTFLTLLPLLSAILIVIGNLLVGQIIEKTKTKAGKARPWILLSSILLGASCIVMFTAPLIGGSSNVAKMILIAISYNLYYSVAYPLYNTANSTMVPLSTRDSKQRGLLASATNVAHLGVMGAGSMVFPILAGYLLKESAGAWAIAFVVIGIFTFLVTVLQYYFTRERVTEETMDVPEEAKEKISVGKQLKAVVGDKFWWLIILFYFVFQFSGGLKNLAMVEFCKNVLATSDFNFGLMQSILGVLGAVPMAIAMVFIWPLSNKVGKQAVVIGGLLVGIVGGVFQLIGASTVNFIIVAIGVALKCFGSAPACYMILAMIADMLDHLEAKNGFRCDGLTMSIYSSIMVASTPCMQALYNGLSAALKNPGLTATISYIWIETIAYAVCSVILLFFGVEKHLKEDRETILARQKAECEARGEVWVSPEEKLRLEQEAAEQAAAAATNE